MLNWFSSVCSVQAGHAGSLYVNTTSSMVNLDLTFFNSRRSTEAVPACAPDPGDDRPILSPRRRRLENSSSDVEAAEDLRRKSKRRRRRSRFEGLRPVPQEHSLQSPARTTRTPTAPATCGPLETSRKTGARFE